MSALTAPSVNLRPYADMGWRERAFAALLAIRRGWRIDRADWQYDSGQDTVVVSVPKVGQTWARVRHELAETLELIERARGNQTRVDVEEYIRG